MGTTVLLVLVLSRSGASAAPPGHPVPHPSRSTYASQDTLAWVGTGAVTTAGFVRRIEMMPWPGKGGGAAELDSAKVRALQSLVGEELLAQEAERQGLGDAGGVARMRASLRKALVRDALYHEVVAATPEPTAAEVERSVRLRSLHATPDARRKLRRAAADSLRGVGERQRAAAFMSRMLGGERAVVDSATFMLLADSLRSLMAGNSDAPPSPRGYELLPEYVEVLRARLRPALERPLVRLPGGPLQLGDALEELRFYVFTLHSLEAGPFAAELSVRLRTIVEGEWMAREGLRRHLDQRPDVRRDLDMWTAAWRAKLLVQWVAAGAETSSASSRHLAARASERARDQAPEPRAERVARYVATLAERNRIEMNYAALRGVDVSPVNMVTRRRLGFGGGMVAAPSLTPLWDWVPIWRASRATLP